MRLCNHFLFQFHRYDLEIAEGISETAVLQGQFFQFVLHQIAEVRFLCGQTDLDGRFGAFVRAFIEPQDGPLSFLCLFHRFADDVRLIALDGGIPGRDRRLFSRCGQYCHRLVEVVRQFHRFALAERSRVRAEGVSKGVFSLIGFGVGIGGRAQKRKLDHAVVKIMPVFAIVQDTDAVAAVRKGGGVLPVL